MTPPADIQRASRALGERGLEAAGRGELHEARRLLTESVELADDDPRYLKALGYCAFAVGDIGSAYHAWRKAEMLLGGRGSLPWVRSLEHGILRVSVDRYNSAVTLAHQEKYREAVTMLDRVLEEIPDFAPAGKAKGLALLGLGDRLGAHTAWMDQRTLVRDDPDFDRLIAAVPVRTASPAAAAVAIPAAALPAAAFAAQPEAAPPAVLPLKLPWRAIGFAAAVVILAAIAFWPRGNSAARRTDSAAAVAPATVAPVVTPPPVIEEKPLAPPPPSQRANFTSRYQQGAAAAHRGDWPRVISYLSPLSELATRESFHPHVLALLTEAYTRTNRSADARRIAFKLIQKYPNSEYITDELREIAGVAEEREK